MVALGQHCPAMEPIETLVTHACQIFEDIPSSRQQETQWQLGNHDEARAVTHVFPLPLVHHIEPVETHPNPRFRLARRMATGPQRGKMHGSSADGNGGSVA